MLQKENVVFPAVEENQPVLAKPRKKKTKSSPNRAAAGLFAMDVCLPRR